VRVGGFLPLPHTGLEAGRSGPLIVSKVINSTLTISQGNTMIEHEGPELRHKICNLLFQRAGCGGVKVQHCGSMRSNKLGEAYMRIMQAPSWIPNIFWEDWSGIIAFNPEVIEVQLTMA
jgi:hypothetical protein